jgi:transaldolase
LPLATLEAFYDHGEVRESQDSDLASAEFVLASLAQAGISLDRVTDYLVTDGLRLFSNSFDNLLAAVATKVSDRRRLETRLSLAEPL